MVIDAIHSISYPKCMILSTLESQSSKSHAAKGSPCFSKEDIEDAIKERVPEKFWELNLNSIAWGE